MIFVYHTTVDILITLVYINGIILIGSNSTLISMLIGFLYQQFFLRDLGPLHYILGVEAHWTFDGIHLSQTKYIFYLLSPASMIDSKPFSVSMAIGSILSIHDGSVLDNGTEFHNIIGALQYCTITRPNIAFVVNKICQFLHVSTDVHWIAVKCILRYLKSSSHFGLIIQPCFDFNLVCYADTNLRCFPDGR